MTRGKKIILGLIIVVLVWAVGGFGYGLCKGFYDGYRKRIAIRDAKTFFGITLGAPLQCAQEVPCYGYEARMLQEYFDVDAFANEFGMDWKIVKSDFRPAPHIAPYCSANCIVSLVSRHDHKVYGIAVCLKNGSSWGSKHELQEVEEVGEEICRVMEKKHGCKAKRFEREPSFVKKFVRSSFSCGGVEVAVSRKSSAMVAPYFMVSMFPIECQYRFTPIATANPLTAQRQKQPDCDFSYKGYLILFIHVTNLDEQMQVERQLNAEESRRKFRESKRESEKKLFDAL